MSSRGFLLHLLALAAGKKLSQQQRDDAAAVRRIFGNARVEISSCVGMRTFVHFDGMGLRYFLSESNEIELLFIASELRSFLLLKDLLMELK